MISEQTKYVLFYTWLVGRRPFFRRRSVKWNNKISSDLFFDLSYFLLFAYRRRWRWWENTSEKHQAATDATTMPTSTTSPTTATTTTTASTTTDAAVDDVFTAFSRRKHWNVGMKIFQQWETPPRGKHNKILQTCNYDCNYLTCLFRRWNL